MHVYPTCWELDAIPGYGEYLKAVKSAKNRKSGTDCISAELLKYTSSEKLNPAVYQILVKIWETSEVPDSFLQLILCSIPKKGDSSVCENHRGISLIAHVSKVLTLLINTRVTNYVEHQQILPESQSGFRKTEVHQIWFWQLNSCNNIAEKNAWHYFWLFWVLQRCTTQ